MWSVVFSLFLVHIESSERDAISSFSLAYEKHKMMIHD